jgi:hypothetical protein
MIGFRKAQAGRRRDLARSGEAPRRIQAESRPPRVGNAAHVGNQRSRPRLDEAVRRPSDLRVEIDVALVGEILTRRLDVCRGRPADAARLARYEPGHVQLLRAEPRPRCVAFDEAQVQVADVRLRDRDGQDQAPLGVPIRLGIGLGLVVGLLGRGELDLGAVESQPVDLRPRPGEERREGDVHEEVLDRHADAQRPGLEADLLRFQRPAQAEPTPCDLEAAGSEAVGHGDDHPAEATLGPQVGESDRENHEGGHEHCEDCA